MENRKFDGVIFDVDGTLWEATDIVARAWNQAFEDFGRADRVTGKQLQGLFGQPMDVIFENVVSDADSMTGSERQDFFRVMTDYEFRYLKKDSAKVYDGLVETFRILAKRYPLAIVSNCQAGYIEILLEKTGLEPYVKGHLCPDDTGFLKAGNICVMADRLGMKNPVYVGDTVMDAAACRAAGVAFIHAAYGFGVLDPEGRDREIGRIGSLNELPGLLETMR